MLSQDLREMIDQITVPAMREATEKDYYFYTIWIVIDKTLNRLVAELGFKGLPDERSEIEIGYGTFPLSRGQGYMTEAVCWHDFMGEKFSRHQIRYSRNRRRQLPSIRCLKKQDSYMTNKHDTRIVWKYQL